MPRSIKFSNLSISVKLLLSLLALASGLLTILFLLIIPKMEKEQYSYKIKQVEQTIALNTQQLKLSVDYIISDGKANATRIKDSLEYKIHKIEDKLQTLDDKNKALFLKEQGNNLGCELSLIDNKSKKPKYEINELSNDGYIQFKSRNATFNKWHVFTKKEEENLCPTLTKHITYSKKFDENSSIFLSCNTDVFYNHEHSKESEIKKYIQKSFSYTNPLHKGKTFLMWLNVEDASNEPLYNREDNIKNNKYCISKLSDVDAIKTGLLSAKQILEASEGKPIIHMMDKENDIGNYKYKAISWIRSINNHEKRRLIFVTTIYKEDLDNNIDSVFWKILPASLLALIFSIITGFLLFRKFSKSLDVLVKTSKEVRLGNINLRSNIKGKDHIGELGHTFDLMLDSMENNIKNLDSKVEYRTSELKKSLDEKNTLLKEIHHRVKNNLSFTINLIKLQKRKVSDESTKELLTDVEERIYIMELLHRKLYESKDLNSIPFKKYINELVEDITYAYNINDLKLNIDIDEVFMDIEHALPCGLIINECITNSFKYAFGDKENEFSIIFRKEKNKCLLEIWDNGKGLPDNLDINKTKSLGLRLISSISKGQLLGQIKYINDKGVKFIITFDIEE
ncbi:histidine kinase dimerization/phosphoacceptor domain -containing protein [Poseidonibacter lekithochrous]|uniref:histidine kinase dimerization/phosphoacceptor domain -containing protein n=1 Tax=Poseidonibacter lekithochrous TaxID=1904463 RepID=UPI0008FC67B9|nr:histidine kinase dimerization/phosphoacceptor domain -containing protein [Poseidonibacter lekithochrous]QKJ22549.1 two-component system sensor histidine kinase [Poseidonibacter lekithochrous]